MKKSFLLAAATAALALAIGASAAQAQGTIVVRHTRSGTTTTTLSGGNATAGRSTPSLSYQQQAPTGNFYNGAGITRPLPPLAPEVQRDGRVNVDGSVARAVRSRKPLQMINPFAPAQYGDGSDMVTRVPDDPDQRPRGFKLLAFEF
ncbi:MAG: hypothetical protein JO117_01170 [Verrucomicrobia bacterium]|nr:hypothetical protein [Verrucomicrobiota bacterium]MBV9656861.1 hypothetical protein [Verrucomicrobiota bacterium]